MPFSLLFLKHRPSLPVPSPPSNRALFQAFSDCPPLSPNTLSPPSSATADGRAAQLISTSSDTHNHASRGRVDLPAFLEVCSRAGLLSSAVKVARPCHGEGFALGMSRERGGRADSGRRSERAGDWGVAGGRLREAGTEENVSTPGEHFFVSCPYSLCKVFFLCTVKGADMATSATRGSH